MALEKSHFREIRWEKENEKKKKKRRRRKKEEEKIREEFRFGILVWSFGLEFMYGTYMFGTSALFGT